MRPRRSPRASYARPRPVPSTSGGSTGGFGACSPVSASCWSWRWSLGWSPSGPQTGQLASGTPPPSNGTAPLRPPTLPPPVVPAHRAYCTRTWRPACCWPSKAPRATSPPRLGRTFGATLTRAGALVGVRDVGAMAGDPGGAWIASVSASPTEALVATHVLGHGVRLFDAATLAPLPFADAAPGSIFVAFSPSGQQLVALEPDHQAPRLYDVPSGLPSRQQPGGVPEGFRVPVYTWQNAVEVAFSRNGSRMVAVLQPPGLPGDRSMFGQTMVWDIADPSEPVFTVRLPAFTQSALSPDGNRLFVVTRRDPPLRVYDVASGRLMASTRSTLLTRLGATG